MLRTGQYINLYGNGIEYDAYVILGEVADELTPDEVDAIEEVLTPIISKTELDPYERRKLCNRVLEAKCDAGDIEVLGWGYDVIIVK